MDQQFSTPMMKQYAEIKKNYADCILFYRLGDFYETFLEDAHITSRVLSITLTSRSRGKDGRIPMAGIPYHAVDSYLAKLIKSGYNVAICEQVSEPNGKGLVEREVVRVVTPGTILDEKGLNKQENNYIVSLVFHEPFVSFAVADLSTGQCFALERNGNIRDVIRDEFGRISPRECLICDEDYNTPELLKILKEERGMNITCFKEWDTYTHDASSQLKDHFGVTSLEAFGLDGKPYIIKAATALLGYLKTTQKDAVKHITAIHVIPSETYLHMDRSTLINLELFSTIREHDTSATLLYILNDTKTAMGARLLRNWIKKPLCDKDAIDNRLAVVRTFLTDVELRLDLRNIFAEITDIERILSRLSVGIGNARDLLHLKSSLSMMLLAKQRIGKTQTVLLNEYVDRINQNLTQIVEEIENTITDSPPVSIREGGMIKVGIDSTLDQLREDMHGGKTWIATLEQKERERTGISSLKIRYNSVFGFYIEISKANMHLAPKDYIRKQTLVNGERFITPELKSYEEKILGAEEEIHRIEYALFQSIVERLLSFTSDIQHACGSIAAIDCLISFAHVSETNRYTCPTLLASGEIQIREGRHPVVEKLLDSTQFVPNDVYLDPESQQLLIITGPNMAGKSVFIRQIALIVLMAHIGCFVPATEARISVVDRIFVRSGASDVISSGLSTFMVEMVETAYILNHATEKSLIIMDEIGRGTSTYDGISIAWAVAEYLVTNKKSPAKTLFATHYHELKDLEKQYPKKIKNFHMAVIEEQHSPVFLHTLMPGGASASFGVAVAKLAGVPEVVITKANMLLKTFENLHNIVPSHTSIIESKIRSLDISRITPLDALTMLASLQDQLNNNANNS